MDDKTVKLGVIGLGNIAQAHINNVLQGEVKNTQLTAVCSRQQGKNALEGVCHFTSYQSLIDSGMVDAVLIATPTMSHFEIAQYALQKNLHVLLEKPIGLSSFEGEQLVASVQPGTQFALMLNQRTDANYLKIKQIVDSGVLGEITRTHWTMTNWFRPEIYFQASDWRATWKGEGGGALVNQCIHNIDIFQWICGVPESINGFCEFGKYHDIEVEDEVTAYFRYANKATGVFVASTGESPGVNRFDVIGDKGSLHFDAGKLIQKLNQQSTHAFSKSTTDMFGTPEVTTTDITANAQINQHAIILNNFVRAILFGETLMTPAQAGLASLDIANAILMSSWTNQQVKLPLDRKAYQSLLEHKIESSNLRVKSNIQATIDMSKSYR
ncbi:Gfo/Idh/MocA family oxidoreductase [Catenovulum sp. 2E275]|uniref:Gfo/Idh/MocA family protein n=1 Tax=Catenovulum sp. 2E275 TaxID=2980497 RepID=UPI0021CF3990|nr:Gfo/Idh/MocA family oxidoreductase [Catenovulum sp. 2E275]MCU4677627.1 Gfo/Idh/MocA family oxidoreductase [Catenovulum sp. 2E275]